MVLTPLIELMVNMTEMSGYLHDLGKATLRFQKKLDAGVKNRKSVPDPIRHEVVSVLMSSELLGALPLMTSGDQLSHWCSQSMKARLEDVRGSCDNVTATMKRVRKHMDALFEREAWDRSHCVTTGILWLVLSHHRMPEGRNGAEGLEPSIGEQCSHFLRYDNAGSIADEGVNGTVNLAPQVVRENLTLVTGALPWDEPQWQVAVMHCWERIQRCAELIKDNLPANALNSDPFGAALAFIARTALIAADYEISEQKQPSGNIRLHSAYANSAVVDGTLTYADTLGDHLLWVGRRSVSIMHLLIHQQGELNAHYPSMPLLQRLQTLSALESPSEHLRFRWQDRLREKLEAQRSNNPFFASVVGKTGSGKTRGNVMLMHSLCQDMRFTCAIGLRSLVTQTYKSYQESFIGFNQTDIALLIGESAANQGSAGDSLTGAGNDQVMDNLALSGEYEIQGSTEALHPLAHLLHKTKQRAMISSPVQIMTVDHIIPGASLGKGADIKVLIHLMGTDIVLDEIDDYPIDSMAALTRMAFISGLFGRRFVISSATASPIIQTSFQASWSNGIALHRILFNRDEMSSHRYLVSHVQGHEVIMVDQDADFSIVCSDFSSAVAREARGSTAHRVELCHVYQQHVTDIPWMRSSKAPIPHPFYHDIASAYRLNDAQHDCLVRTVKIAHSLHHVEHHSIRVSSGFVRFNQVASAQRLALMINEITDPDILYMPVCYHAHMTFADRQSTEDLLSTLNCRKDTTSVMGDERIFGHHYAIKAIKRAISEGKSDIIFVLCTTQIIEVGRDHDYDWAILEPCSTRSMVQSCGRVWRHRIKRLEEGVPNVWLMSRTVKVLCGASQLNPRTGEFSLTWNRYGIEDDVFESKPVVALRKPLTPRSILALKDLAIGCEGWASEVRSSRFVKRALPKPLLGSSDAWYELLEAPGADGSIHSGLCLEKPRGVSESVMGSLEWAQQQIHLMGLSVPDNRFEFEKPTGLAFSGGANQWLTSHHAIKRQLRSQVDTVSLTYCPIKSGYDLQGRQTECWLLVDGIHSKPVNLNRPLYFAGTLFIPPPLREVIEESGLSGLRQSHLSIRQDQVEWVLNGKMNYVPGIGAFSS